MKTTLHIAAIVACFGLAACDDGPADDLGSDRAADLEADADQESSPTAEAGPAKGLHGKRHRRGHGPKKLMYMCDTVECTDAQKAQLTELMLEGKSERHRGHKEGRKAANEALATAYRGEALSQADIDAYETAVQPHGNPRRDRLVKMATSVHAILTPEQRAKLADEVTAGKLPLFGGKHRHHAGKRGGKHEGKSPADRHARKAGKLCEAVACSDTQLSEIESAFGKLPAPTPPDQAAIDAFASAFRGDSLSTSDVETFADAMSAGHDANNDAMAALALQLHGILDADQRGTIADRIERRGLHAVAGKRGGKHGRKRGRHGKRRGRSGDERPAGPADAGAQGLG